MNRWAAILFLVVVGVQVAGLLAFAGVREVALARGREVVLQTVPVDPRSLLQGDYAILDYEIARLPGYSDDTPVGEVVYVGLREHRGVWYSDGYFFDEAPSRTDLYIRGVVDRPGHLDFGIDTYFVPEGTGRAIERGDDVKVVAVLDRNGRAVIKQVLVDGDPFDPNATE
jgi:uncharacterized membrane-anchored protein